VPQGSRVDAVAAPTVLMVCNWPVQSERYARVARFVDALFDKIEQLHSPRHPKWRDTVICANVRGCSASNRRRTGSMSGPVRRRHPRQRRSGLRNSAAFRLSGTAARMCRMRKPPKLYADFLRWREGQR
jgi:uncharacterized protein